jgi:hypothetical protein
MHLAENFGIQLAGPRKNGFAYSIILCCVAFICDVPYPLRHLNYLSSLFIHYIVLSGLMPSYLVVSC